MALVHDFLLDLRGGERVFLELCRMWPEADVFTAIYDEEGTEGRFAERNVHTSFLQHLRPSARTFRVLFPLYPRAIESFDFSSYDLVVSSSSAWAHGVRCPEDTLHVSYCHNPFRYAWNEREATVRSRHNPLTRSFLRSALTRWRSWDIQAARRTDRYIANSMVTQSRLQAYFRRESRVVYPPVNTERFGPGPVGSHYVVLGELMAHKQIDVAIAAFNQLRLPLVVIGDGPAGRTLRRQAGPTVTFTGRIPDATVETLVRSARAMVVPSVEEFGIAAVESQAAGRPVLARAGGGTLETVIQGKTGCFWSGGPQELAGAVLGFDDAAVDPHACVRNAARFDVANFRHGIRREVRAVRAGADELTPALSAARTTELLANPASGSAR